MPPIDVRISDEGLIEIVRKRMVDVQEVLSRWNGKSGRWYWVEFRNTLLPTESQLLGAAIVKAPIPMAVEMVTRLQHIHPGPGLVFWYVIPDTTIDKIPAKYLWRLLNYSDILEIQQQVVSYKPGGFEQ